MLTINKMTSTSPVDFAAEELKKYLRMMMPECGDIKIAYNPLAADGIIIRRYFFSSSAAKSTGEVEVILLIVSIFSPRGLKIRFRWR